MQRTTPWPARRVPRQSRRHHDLVAADGNLLRKTMRRVAIVPNLGGAMPLAGQAPSTGWVLEIVDGPKSADGGSDSF